MLSTVIDPASVIRDALSKRETAPTTLTALAPLIGLSLRQLQARLRGEVDWRLSELRDVARVLEVDLASLTKEDA